MHMNIEDISAVSIEYFNDTNERLFELADLFEVINTEMSGEDEKCSDTENLPTAANVDTSVLLPPKRRRRWTSKLTNTRKHVTWCVDKTINNQTININHCLASNVLHAHHLASSPSLSPS